MMSYICHQIIKIYTTKQIKKEWLKSIKEKQENINQLNRLISYQKMVNIIS